jgi:hypothetical protein
MHNLTACVVKIIGWKWMNENFELPQASACEKRYNKIKGCSPINKY